MVFIFTQTFHLNNDPQYISLRYKLIPYVKRLFEMLQTSGKTIMRALYYDFSNDPFVFNGTARNDPAIITQYMFGAFYFLKYKTFHLLLILTMGYRSEVIGCTQWGTRRYFERSILTTSQPKFNQSELYLDSLVRTPVIQQSYLLIWSQVDR